MEARSRVYLFAKAKYDIKCIDTSGAHGLIAEVRSAVDKKKSKGTTQVRALHKFNRKSSKFKKILDREI